MNTHHESDKPMKLMKVKSKPQTTKIIIYTILVVWILVTGFMLGSIVFLGPQFEQMSAMQSVYQLVSIVMIQGVIGYVVKSTIENKSKYGTTPYGGVEIAPGVLDTSGESINGMAAANYISGS